MTLLLDGGGILVEYWRSLLPIVVVVLGFGGLGVSVLPGVTAGRKWLAFPLSLGTGLILLTPLTYLLFLVSLAWRGVLTVGAYAILLAGAICFVLSLRRSEMRAGMAVGLPLLLLVLTVRLAFVSQLYLPPYSDAPTHYLIVLNLLDPSSRPDALYTFGSLLQHYYHFGVHCLTAWAALTSQETSPLLLAVIGQFLLSLVPFSVFALAGMLSEGAPPAASRVAAWAAALVSLIGWWMPAFAANWAKYPTLAGLAALPAPLAYLLAVGESARKRAYLVFTGLLIVGLILLHSRTSLLIGLVLAGYLLARLAARRLPNVPLPAALAILLTGALAYLGWLHPELSGFYTANWALLAFIAVLVPFAATAFPEAALGTLLAAAGMILLTTLPAPRLLSNQSFALIDRPFVQTALYLPLAVLAGLGIAGLARHQVRTPLMSILPAALLVLLLIVGMPPLSAYYADSCCNFASRDDVRALEWLRLNASPQARVVIAGLQTGTRLVETDAGAWVYAMTGLDTAKRSYNSTLYDPGFIAGVCQGDRDVYLYAGGGPTSFEVPPLPVIAADYNVIYSSGDTRILFIRVCAQH